MSRAPHDIQWFFRLAPFIKLFKIKVNLNVKECQAPI